MTKANSSKVEVKNFMEIMTVGLKRCFIPIHGKMRFVICPLALLAALMFCVPVAHAYKIGARAASMGGAFIALSDDASGTYHNPAGLVFAVDNEFSMNGNLYGYNVRRIEGGMRYGKQETDLVYKNYWAVPSFFGTVNKIGSGKDGQSRHALGFSIVIPDYEYWRAISEIDDGKVRKTLNEKFQTYWFGPSYAYRVTPSLGIGATLYGLYYEDQVSMSSEGMLDGKNLSGTDEDITFIEKEEQQQIAASVLLSIGAKYVIRTFHIGLNVKTTNLHLWGDGKHSITDYFSDREEGSEGVDNYVTYEKINRTPLTVGLGFARLVPQNYTIALDLEYAAPLKWKDSKNMKGDTNAFAVSEFDQPEIITVNAGFEKWLKNDMSLLAGLYTELDADLYGLTVAVGKNVGDFDINLGLGYELAMYSEEREYMANDGNFDYRVCDAETQRIYFILGTTFHYDGAEDETGLGDKLKKRFMP